MRKTTILKQVLMALTLSIALLAMSGCKAQQQMQQQVADIDAKIADATRRMTAMDADLKKANFEITQLKGLVTKLGNITVDLQKAEEDRQKAAAEAKNRGGSKKPVAKGKPMPKKHK